MRKLIYSINLSIDGCCDHEKMVLFDDMHELYANLLTTADTFLYGRKTYQLMVPYWPDVAKNNSGEDKATNDFAKAFDAVRKIVVFSKSLQTTDPRTVIFRGNVKEEIMKLKQEEGKDILLGGVDLPSQIMELGLVDEYQFVILPVIAGEGRRLIEIKNRFQLKLVESRTLRSGCILLRYQKN